MLAINTKIYYKGIPCIIVGYSNIHDGKDYVIQPEGWSVYYQRIVRYDDKNIKEEEEC